MKKLLKIIAIFVVSLFLSTSANAFSIIKSCGYFYVGILNPVEMLTSSTRVVEEQHITPQQYYETEAKINKVILISRTNHTVSDRWKNKPYIQKHENIILSLITFGNQGSQERLNAAYRMGCYVMPYAFFCYDYRKDNWSLVATQLDACSSILYSFSWIINIPQKFINKIAYICQARSEPSIFTLFDIITNIIMVVIDFAICIAGTIIGVILGFIFHPFDSLCSILGMIYFGLFSIFTAIFDCFTGVFSLLTFWR